MSTFCGKLKESEFNKISIDSFTEENCQSKLFFLSHYHSDHMKGIGGSCFVQKFKYSDDIRLYCSDITRQLLIKNYVWASEQSHKIIALEKRVTRIALDNSCFQVTMLNAGHCPGSVMFLFEGFGLNILYTGDFRCSLSDAKKFKALHEKNGDVLHLNSIYLDTTLVSADYIEFPSRDESLVLIKNIIEEWFAKGDKHSVSIKPTSNIGVEFLMFELGYLFKTSISITETGFQNYQFPLINVINLVADASKSRIHFCLNKYGVCNSCSRDNLVIYPTALMFDSLTLKIEGPVIWLSDKEVKVAYSSHSSLHEIGQLVSYLKPENIYACVVHDTTETEIINLIKYVSDKYKSSDAEGKIFADVPDCSDGNSNANISKLSSIDRRKMYHSLGLDSPPRNCDY